MRHLRLELPFCPKQEDKGENALCSGQNSKWNKEGLHQDLIDFVNQNWWGKVAQQLIEEQNQSQGNFSPLHPALDLVLGLDIGLDLGLEFEPRPEPEPAAAVGDLQSGNSPTAESGDGIDVGAALQRLELDCRATASKKFQPTPPPSAGRSSRSISPDPPPAKILRRHKDQQAEDQQAEDQQAEDQQAEDQQAEDQQRVKTSRKPLFTVPERASSLDMWPVVVLKRNLGDREDDGRDDNDEDDDDPENDDQKMTCQSHVKKPSKAFMLLCNEQK